MKIETKESSELITTPHDSTDLTALPSHSNVEEQTAVERIRVRFEGKYGDLSDVMRSILRWRHQCEEFNRPFNRQMEIPVTEADVDVAESAMLAAIRAYKGAPVMAPAQ